MVLAYTCDFSSYQRYNSSYNGEVAPTKVWYLLKQYGSHVVEVFADVVVLEHQASGEQKLEILRSLFDGRHVSQVGSSSIKLRPIMFQTCHSS